MLSERVLVVGRPDPLCRNLSKLGAIQHQPSHNRRLWSGLASGAWDACVFDFVELGAIGYELVRHARETQPALAILVAGADEREATRVALASGADDALTSGMDADVAAERIARAVAARRGRGRQRLEERAHIVLLEWDQLETPAVRDALLEHDFVVSLAEDARSALGRLRESCVDILVTPPGAELGSASITQAALRYDPRLRIIVASDVSDLERTAAVIAEGAHDYLLRPVGSEQVVGAVQSAWASHVHTSPGGEPRPRPLGVLLLEPHALQGRLVEEMLAQDERFATTLVRDPEAARRMLEEGAFDAILYRPDPDRGAAIRFLHELRYPHHGPAIVLLTAHPDIGFHELALRMGVQDIIATPRLGREALGARVRNAVERNQYRLAQERFVRDLERREASQLEVVRRSMDGMLIVDALGTVLFANPAGEQMLSGLGEPVLGKRFPYATGEATPREVQLRDSDSPRIAEMTQVGIDWNGFPARLISLRDVTERRQAQELRDRLAHSERLAAIGQLAAGVTHEINNPAAYVVTNLTTMLESIAELERYAWHPDSRVKLAELAEMVRENLDGMSRIRAITNDLRTFARIDSSEVSLVDLNDCVVAACKIAFNEIRHRAHLVQALGDLPKIAGSHGKLAQVVINLLVNAAQAIPEGNVEGNRVTVRTGSSEDEVWLQVEDTGRGIDPQVRARMFDPFFTTKARTQGTGLGLALCADIVRQHQGTITPASGSAGGTCFEVRLPRNTLLEPSAPPPATSQIVPRARSSAPLRLLLIDDEPLVLRSLRRMLGEHHVDAVQSGREALALLQRDRDYDLIFCDLMMPEMDGTIFYGELERLRPDLAERVIFCSGGAFTTRTKEFAEQSRRPFVEKPLTREVFERVVAEHGAAPRVAAFAR